MLRDRLIFGLIYNNGAFMHSRNFRLQRVGDINWLEKNYKFQKISFSLDELIVLNASKEKKDIKEFSKIVNRLVSNVFIPVAAGGGIRTLDDAVDMFSNGADKIILNTSLYTDPDFVMAMVEKFGSQSLVACVDYKFIDDIPKVLIEDGSRILDIEIEHYLNDIQSLGVGEILLNSIDRDGTGFGYDLETVNKLSDLVDVPLIVMGGAGNEKHLFEGIQKEYISAVATANLFNFIGNGLPNARSYLIENEANLAVWHDR